MIKFKNYKKMKIIFFLAFLFALNAKSEQCNLIDDDYKVDCFPETWSSLEICESRGCCWSLPNKTNSDVPYCFYPNNYNGYEIIENSYSNLKTLHLKRVRPSGFPSDFDTIQIEMIEINEFRVQVRVKPVDSARWVPPIKLDLDAKNCSDESKLYKFETDQTFVKLIRKETNQVVWKMNYKNLIFSDQWLQAETHLPSLNLFGLGEYKDTYRKQIDKERKRFLFFNQGDPPYRNRPLYSSHPQYLAYENADPSNKVLAHTVLLLNSNAIEVVLSPGKILVWRSLGGQLDFYINLGSNPEDAVSKYVQLVGKPPLPPYWSLGFQLSRYGFKNLNEMKQVYNRMRENSLPLDVLWNDIDLYRNHNIFSYDNVTFEGLPEFIDELHKNGMAYIPMLDPGLGGNFTNDEYPAFYDGLKRDVFLKTANNTLLKTRVWNTFYTLWIDFTNQNASDFWIEQIGKLYEEIEFDGIWIDMNSPDANGVDGSLEGCNWSDKYETPYFAPNGLKPLARNTACMGSKHAIGIHYDIHNMYSYFEANITNLALKRLRKRPFIISRSSFVGHGRYAMKWTGDVSSNWDDLRVSISNMLTFNVIGIPVVGADICGFLGNTDDELCARWQSLGAFYTFSRNHNDINSIDQDPPSLNRSVVDATRFSLNVRYSLLPLLYTELFKSSQDGRPVVKALSLAFPNDLTTYDIENEFLWGDSILIVPVVEQGRTKVNAYLPAGIWYDYIKQTIVSNSNQGKYLEMQIPLDRIGVLVRGGSILLTQEPKLTTKETRKGKFDLVVALDKDNQANGDLYWDDGVDFKIERSKNYNFIHFHVHKNVLFNKVYQAKYEKQPLVKSITVLGVNSKVNRVTLNGEEIQFNYDERTSRLFIKFVNQVLDLKKQFVLVWY